MTLRDWQWRWWRKTTPDMERRESVAVRPASPRVAAHYLALYTYLEHRYASNVVLTFEQMEALMGFPLPPAARTERDWWTSAIGHADRHPDAWTAAGRTATPNLVARTVSFERLP